MTPAIIMMGAILFAVWLGHYILSNVEIIYDDATEPKRTTKRESPSMRDTEADSTKKDSSSLR